MHRHERFSSSTLFQFTPLREGRRTEGQFAECTGYFNSRPSARGDASNLRDTWIAIYFNSRPSARGDGDQWGNWVRKIKFQFTPLREGRREGVFGSRRQCPRISIHAPPRGATPRKSLSAVRRSHFNSRPSARGDTSSVLWMPMDKWISIHAPPRGATARWLSIVINILIFQFTPLREGRQQKICNFCKSFVQPLQISMA